MKRLVSSVAFAVVCSSSAQQPPQPASDAGAPFSEVPVAVPDKLRFLAPLGDFDATDIDGHHWHATEMRGKVTFVDVWATTCGPCLREHPEIQRFYDKWKDSDKVQVLTFSTDTAPSAVKKYMLASKYTFPVIVNEALSEKLFSNLGIPQSWVIDRQGFRSERFNSWSLGRILLEVERFATTSRK